MGSVDRKDGQLCRRARLRSPVTVASAWPRRHEAPAHRRRVPRSTFSEPATGSGFLPSAIHRRGIHATCSTSARIAHATEAVGAGCVDVRRARRGHSRARYRRRTESEGAASGAERHAAGARAPGHGGRDHRARRRALRRRSRNRAGGSRPDHAHRSCERHGHDGRRWTPRPRASARRRNGRRLRRTHHVCPGDGRRTRRRRSQRRRHLPTRPFGLHCFC